MKTKAVKMVNRAFQAFVQAERAAKRAPTQVAKKLQKMGTEEVMVDK